MNADSDQVASPYPESLSQAPHPGPLVSIDCVERVRAGGEGANFDNNRGGAVASHDVDFATGDHHITGDDVEAVFDQVAASKELAELSGGESS